MKLHTYTTDHYRGRERPIGVVVSYKPRGGVVGWSVTLTLSYWSGTRTVLLYGR